MNDLISRQAAIDALDEFIQWCDKALRSPLITSVDAYAVKVEKASLKHYREVLELLEPAQPETYDLTANIENVLALLDGIHSSGRMEYYSDYCALHDAIAGLLPG